MNKAIVIMPLDEYEELGSLITNLEQKCFEEHLRNEEYNNVLSKLRIDKGIIDKIINGAEVKCCEQREPFTNRNCYRITIILDNGEERY